MQVVTGKRVYYLKADSPNLLEEWLRVLHSVLRLKAASPLFTQPDIRPVMKGLLVKVQPFNILLTFNLNDCVCVKPEPADEMCSEFYPMSDQCFPLVTPDR